MLWHIILFSGTLVLAGCESHIKELSTNSPEAIEAYIEGSRHYNDFNYNEAANSFARAVEIDSAFGLAWGKLALISMAGDNERLAHEYIDKAFKFVSTISLRERYYLRMWNHFIRFRNDNALAVADSLLREYPDEPEALVFCGRMHESRKRLDEAIKSYKLALEVDSSYGPAAMSLGYAYSHVGENKKALAYMDQYIRLGPKSADPLASYGDLLLFVGDYDAARTQYKKSLEVQSDYWYSHRQLGVVHMIAGRLKDAEQEFLQGMKGLPENKRNAWSMAMLAEMSFYRGEYKRALQEFQESYSLDSTNPGIRYGGIRALTKLRDFKGAQVLLHGVYEELERRNMTSSPVMLGYYLARARWMAAQQLYEEALILCDSATAFTTPLTRAHVSEEEAEIYLAMKAYEQSFAACEEALRMNPNNPDALLTLVQLYHARRDRKMTNEIGMRLLRFWNQADGDFVKLRELRGFLPNSSQTAS